MAVKPPSGVVFGLLGTGGFAREVMPFARAFLSNLARGEKWPSVEVYFVDKTPKTSSINGVATIGEDEFLTMECGRKFFNIAVADSKAREGHAGRCVKAGAEPLGLRAAESIVYDHNEIAEGAILCANTIVTSNAKIGKYFHANIYSYVAHDCVIGDYVTFAPRVHCNGNVRIGDHAYIGTSAIIKQGREGKPLTIGEGAVVGMGAVVTKDVPPFTTVIGNPARPFEKS